MSSEIANRYAKALFKIACESNQLEVCSESLKAIAPLLKPCSHFLKWAASPEVAQNFKIEMLESKLNGLFCQQLIDFFLLLLKKKRLWLLPAIVSQFQRLAAKKLGILEVQLITTVAIDASTKENLASKLKQKFGLTPNIHEEIDPTLIGGSIIKIGSQVIDNSIKGKLLRLKKHLLRGAS